MVPRVSNPQPAEPAPITGCDTGPASQGNSRPPASFSHSKPSCFTCEDATGDGDAGGSGVQGGHPLRAHRARLSPPPGRWTASSKLPVPCRGHTAPQGEGFKGSQAPVSLVGWLLWPWPGAQTWASISKEAVDILRLEGGGRREQRDLWRVTPRAPSSPPQALLHPGHGPISGGRPRPQGPTRATHTPPGGLFARHVHGGWHGPAQPDPFPLSKLSRKCS